MTEERRPEPDDMFRREALDHHRASEQDEGDVLRLSPTWINAAYRVVLGIAVLAMLFLCVGRMSEYAEGPALVRAQLKTEITCPLSAVVQEVLVKPGDNVHTGQLLVQLENEEQRAAVERSEQELQIRLANSLSDPRDLAARREIGSIRSELAFARQMLDARTIVAPHDGVVGDVRTRAGQPVTAGQLVATLVGSNADLKLVLVMPGHFRPQLRAGLPARLELSGYAHAYEPITLSRVSDEVVGPNEARRFLGQDVADAVVMNGPVVVAEAALAHEYFVADGRSYPFVDGLQGRVHVKVRSIPIILGLVPGLRYFYEGRHHGFSG